MKSNLKGLRAVIYGRFSSDMQREESLEAQERDCRKFAHDNGVVIVGEYYDRAKSGTSADREQFQKLIADSVHGGFDLVLIHKIDRFARNRKDSINARTALKRNGVTVISVSQPYDSDRPEGIMMESLLEAMAEYYSRNLALEVEKGKRENALKGLHIGGVPPLGYDVDPQTKRLIINPYEAEAVKLIFSMYLDGLSYGEIVKKLNHSGYKTKQGGEFVTNSLHNVLRNPKYMGLYTYSRSEPKDVDNKRNGHRYKADEDIIKVEGGCPAIVSRDDFEQVQKRMESRKRKPASYRAKRDYLLTGKVCCAQCGTPYIGNCRPARKDHPEYLSYRCNNRTKRPRCSGWEIRKELLESMVLCELANIVFNDSMIPKLKDGYSQYVAEQNQEAHATIKAIQKQIADLQKQMDNIIAVIAQTASNALVEKLNQLDVQKKEYENCLQEVQEQCKAKEFSEEELARSFKQAREMLKSGELSTVRALIERYVNRITINGEDIEIEFNLNVNSRVVTYPAVHSKKKAPQISAVLLFHQPFWLAMRGGELHQSLIIHHFNNLPIIN